MSSASHQIELPEPLVQDALRSAAREGKSLQQWVSSIIEERFRLERHTEEFFKKRAAGAPGNGLRWALDNSPDRPPDAGDELEPEN
jgi:hypothetical protein